MKQSDIQQYSHCYSENKFWGTITKYFARLGMEITYKTLILYYVMTSPYVSWKTKATVIAALGYLISPIDACPDAIPVVGLADDASVISAAYAVVCSEVTPEIQAKAQRKLSDWFGSYAN